MRSTGCLPPNIEISSYFPPRRNKNALRILNQPGEHILVCFGLSKLTLNQSLSQFFGKERMILTLMVEGRELLCLHFFWMTISPLKGTYPISVWTFRKWQKWQLFWMNLKAEAPNCPTPPNQATPRCPPTIKYKLHQDKMESVSMINDQPHSTLKEALTVGEYSAKLIYFSPAGNL